MSEFTNQPTALESQQQQNPGQDRMVFRELQVGAGSDQFEANKEGVFIGGTNYTDAPISFSYDGIQKVKTGGAIQVGDTVVIDATGLNSVNNFVSDTLFDDTNRTTSSTSFEDIPGASMASFTLTRQARVLTYLRAKAYHSDYDTTGDRIVVRMIDTFDNTPTDGVTIAGDHADDVDWDSGTGTINSITNRVSSEEFTSISNDLYAVGTHQFKAQYKVEGGTGNLFEIQIGYVVLGV